MLLRCTKEGDGALVFTRRLDAAPALVWHAYTSPALLGRWMMGPPGWPMTRAQFDPRAGGLIHLEWSDRMGQGLALTGEVIEAEPPYRLLHVERLHLPEASPENVIETLLAGDAGGTNLMLHMRLPDSAARDEMLAGGLAEGLEDSFVRLESLLATGF
ncbi:SRPBCC domain-containing protein [Rhodobacter sp. NTK016B]|uniref:SRPBCC domain-containing protein n=1 Tax=Rhodobacter sp. NTK016B TaxID=2759676 RepID=UPI001A90C126|nr:SRPBCC domain-containing protein [Rhodobacter sp. NTK016B]MBN8291700.1 SRPBCC domain-containing protein [Rhodobacter sp. NTK016B]